MRHFSLLISSLISSIPMYAAANPHELSGTWKYSKTAEYFGSARTTPLPQFTVIQIVNGSLLLQPRCDEPIDYGETGYRYNDLFQMALKAGVDEKAMDRFVAKQFGAPLSSVKYFYQGNKGMAQCNFEHDHLFLLKDKLVLVNAGGAFDGYERIAAPVLPDTSPNLYGRKLSELPYSNAAFHTLCVDLLKRGKSNAETPDMCAPVFYPYRATGKDSDPLAKLIGSHLYRKFGADAGKEYDNPVAHHLHPTFMLLPPLKHVVVVAVEDLQQESSPNRSGMSGAYLAIKQNKVVDQIRSECILQPDYSCADLNGRKQYQLLESGKFQKVKK